MYRRSTQFPSPAHCLLTPQSVPTPLASSHLSARYQAFVVLRDIDKGAFADVALERNIRNFALEPADRRLATELIYGTVRRQRTLDTLIDQLG